MDDDDLRMMPEYLQGKADAQEGAIAQPPFPDRRTNAGKAWTLGYREGLSISVERFACGHWDRADAGTAFRAKKYGEVVLCRACSARARQ